MAVAKRGLAVKALEENLARFVDTKASPKDHNLHVALIQMALQLDAIQDEQRAQRQLLERIAGAVVR